MSKKYKGKTCVYCGHRQSETGDHVVAREFFPIAQRVNLPKVPACFKCNGEKSALEHYLTAVLPFGGRHADSKRNLADEVPRRLAKNRSLHRTLASSERRIWERTPAGTLMPTISVEIDGDRLNNLVGMMVKGLSWFHWHVIIDSDCTIEILPSTEEAEKLLALYLSKNAAAHVTATLGDNVFSYEGAQGVDNPKVGVWHLRIYGGLLLADPNGTVTSTFGIITGPTTIFRNSNRVSNWLLGQGTRG